MSLQPRIINLFRGDELNGDLSEEYETHIAEEVHERRDPLEARSALGSVTQQSQRNHDLRVVGWLDCLRLDFVGWRQLRRSPVTLGGKWEESFERERKVIRLKPKAGLNRPPSIGGSKGSILRFASVGMGLAARVYQGQECST